MCSGAWALLLRLEMWGSEVLKGHRAGVSPQERLLGSLPVQTGCYGRDGNQVSVTDPQRGSGQ